MPVKQEAKRAMIERQKVRAAIPYSGLVEKIKRSGFRRIVTRLFHLLGEISVEENEAGRRMLSVVVVHKRGGMELGRGFSFSGSTLVPTQEIC